jgi:hypothetical protein
VPKDKNAKEPATVIDGIEISLDGSYILASEPNLGIEREVPNGVMLPAEPEYAALSSKDRERAKRVYPKPKRAETYAVGEDLDIV